MKYYLHDSNSFNDEKVTQLFIEFGYEGLGLFYTLLEKLAGQEKPVNTLVLKSQLNVGKRLNKCWNFMESIGIIHSNNGETFNKQLLNFSEKYLIKKQKNTERIKQWRENEGVTKNVTHYERVRNAPKDNISKVKESKVFSVPTIFEVTEYCKERTNQVDPQKFLDHYTSNGWKVGRNSMKDWRASVRTWERSAFEIKKEPVIYPKIGNDGNYIR